MRLIDADALKEKAVPLLFPTKMEPCGHIPVPVQAVVVAEIEQATTIEAEPVRHGRWVNIMSGIIDTTGDCANCGQDAVWRTRNKPYAVCPNCGAKMDGE